MDPIDHKRISYAALVTAKAQVADERIRRAFATVPREPFVGDGPWKILARSGAGYLETPSADPALLYEDVVIALRPEQRINNGEPSLHARCLNAAEIHEGDRVLHIGCGSGYYTALLGELVSETGTVTAWDIDADLAAAAYRNLARWTNISVECRSGTEPPVPHCDVIYVCAGCSAPPRIWIDALADAGRLVFPLTPSWGGGGILKIARRGKHYEAKFICKCWFIPCIGANSDQTDKRVAEAFARGDSDKVCSLRFGSPDSETCWFSGDGWWLSTK